MANGNFDTLAAKEALTGVGIKEDQATVMTYLIYNAISEHVATKTEMMQIRNELLKAVYVATGILLAVLLALLAT